MKKYITISRQVAISFVFSILVFVSGVFRTTVLTRNLTIDEFGAFSIFFISVSFFSVILDLGVSHFITTKLAGVSQRVRIRKFFSILCVGVVYVGCLFLLFQISGIKTLFLSELGLESYGVEFTVVWLIVCVAILFRLYHTYVYSMHKIGFSSFVGFLKLSGWVYLMIGLLLVLKTMTMLQITLVWLAGVLISLLVYFGYTFSDLKRFFRVRGLDVKGMLPSVRGALVFSMPLVPFLIGDWLLQTSDKYILKYYSSFAVVGVYNLAFTLTYFVLAFSTVILGVIYPYYSASWNQKKNHHLWGNIALKYCLMLCLPATMGLWVLREALVTLISGPAYMGAVSIISYLIFFPLFGSLTIVFYQTLMLKGKTKLIGMIYIVGSVLNLVLNFSLIGRYGVIGAAVATTISYVFVFSATYYFAKSHLKINWKFLRLARVLVSVGIMALIVFVLDPKSAVMKFITIVAGGAVYVGCIFVFGVLTKNEISLFKTILKEGKGKLTK